MWEIGKKKEGEASSFVPATGVLLSPVDLMQLRRRLYYHSITNGIPACAGMTVGDQAIMRIARLDPRFRGDDNRDGFSFLLPTSHFKLGNDGSPLARG